MYWTLELASYLEDAPWPASKDELIDFAMRTGAPLEVVENLQALEDEGEVYDTIEEIWPDYPTKEDFFFNEDEYWLTLRLVFLSYIKFKLHFFNLNLFLGFNYSAIFVVSKQNKCLMYY